ncbi:MAG TPA: hypothetical protein PKC17_01725 [Geobacter anodireducens]|nr:hypothetical protein [Geobacter anodireducens]
MKNITSFRMAAVLASCTLLSACADGDLPFADSTSISSPAYSHSVAFQNMTTLAVWGNNESGQLGDGTTTSAATPKRFRLGFATYSSGVATGASHTLAIARFDNVSGVRAWGSNSAGQIGHDPATVPTSATPVKIGGFGGAVQQVAAGGLHSLALAGGTVWAWGSNGAGQLALNPISSATRFAPRQVEAAKLPITPTAIVAGGSHSIAYTSTEAYAWGNNASGQLGNGTTLSSHMPQKVQLPSSITIRKISAGGSHNLALDSTGKIWAWGNNAYGQLGNGTTTNQSTPVQLTPPAGITGFIDVCAGPSHSVAVANDFTVYAWGFNTLGLLSVGTTGDQLSPAQVRDASNAPLSDVERVVLLGSFFTIVKKHGPGGLWSWGYNGYGQLGDGTTSNRIAPVQVHLP